MVSQGIFYVYKVALDHKLVDEQRSNPLSETATCQDSQPALSVAISDIVLGSYRELVRHAVTAE